MAQILTNLIQNQKIKETEKWRDQYVTFWLSNYPGMICARDWEEEVPGMRWEMNCVLWGNFNSAAHKKFRQRNNTTGEWLMTRRHPEPRHPIAIRNIGKGQGHISRFPCHVHIITCPLICLLLPRVVVFFDASAPLAPTPFVDWLVTPKSAKFRFS